MSSISRVLFILLSSAGRIHNRHEIDIYCHFFTRPLLPRNVQDAIVLLSSNRVLHAFRTCRGISNGQYLEAVYMAEKIILQVEER